MPDTPPYHLGFEAGFRCRLATVAETCPFPSETKAAQNWQRGFKQGAKVRVGRNKKNATEGCQRPTDCFASGDGLCRSCAMAKKHKDPEFAARRTEIFRASAEKRWANPENREKWGRMLNERSAKMLADPAIKKKLSDASKKRWADATYRQNRSAQAKEAFEKPGRREQQREVMVRVTSNPEVVAKRKATMKAQYASGQHLSPRRQKKMAEECATSTDSYSEIGKRYNNISASRVRQIARKHGVPPRHRSWLWRKKK